MTSRITSIARMGFAVLVGLILAIGINGDAVAKSGKRHSHGYSHASDGRGHVSGKRVQLAVQQPARLGAMRYYGGPKSPMWRGPAESDLSEGRRQLKPVQLVSQPASPGAMRYYGGPKSPMWRGPS